MVYLNSRFDVLKCERCCIFPELYGNKVVQVYTSDFNLTLTGVDVRYIVNTRDKIIPIVQSSMSTQLIPKLKAGFTLSKFL